MKLSSSPVLFAPTFPQPDKPLMVLLPGLDGTGKLFEPQIASLARHFDLRCLAIPESNRQDWAELAEAVIELIEREQPRRRLTYVCGESFGGCLALQVALMKPAIADRLVLINPASSLNRQTYLRWMSQAAFYVPDWIYTFSGALVFPLLCNFERIQLRWRQLFIETVRPISQACVAWRLRMLQKFEVPTQQLQSLTMPTALISSGRDRLLPSRQEVAHIQQGLPNAVTYCLPESGHVCLIEEAVNLVYCLGQLDFLPVPSALTQRT